MSEFHQPDFWGLQKYPEPPTVHYLPAYGHPDQSQEIAHLKRQVRLYRWAAVIALAAMAVSFIAQAHAQPTVDPNIRALQTVNAELVQAWTGSRAAMLTLQDQLTAAQAEIKDLKDQRSKAEADKAHAIPDPATPK